MVKLFLFILVVSGGTIVGVIASDSLHRIRDSCRLVHLMLLKISVLIRYQALDVYEIVRELRNDSSLSQLAFLSHLPECYEEGANFSMQWREAVAADTTLGEEEQALLFSFGQSFGASDIEGQLLLLESAAASFSELEKQRTANYTQKGKLYRSVGILFGVMAGIALL